MCQNKKEDCTPKRKIVNRIMACAGVYACLEILIASFNLIDVGTVVRNYEQTRNAYREKHHFFYHMQRLDNEFGFTNIPNLVRGGEILDELGLRNKLGDKESASIVGVGDSFTYGEGVEFEESWLHLLGERLGVKTSNFGVTAYSPWQYNKLMAKYKDFFKNRIILYGIYPNDFVDQSSEQVSAHYSTERRGRFRHCEPSFLEVIESLPQKPWVERTLIYHVIDKISSEKRGNITTLSKGIMIEGENEIQRSWLSDENFTRLTRTFDEAREIASSYGSKLVVVFFPSRALVYAETYKRAFKGDDSLDLEAKAFDLTDTFFKKKKIPVIKLLDALRNEARNNGNPYLPFDAHLNPRGNEVIAGQISTLLQEKGYIKSH